MTEAQKILLQQKKAQVKHTQELKSWLPYWLPVFNAVLALRRPWSFEYFDCVKQPYFPICEAAIQQFLIGTYIPITAIIKIPDNYYVHDKMKALFPSSLLLRYMPALTTHVAWETDSALMLSQAAKTLTIPSEEEVYFFYTRFTPVLRLPFSSIGLLREEEIMNPEDLCIMALDGSWLIFRSLENEWTWGYKQPDFKTTL